MEVDPLADTAPPRYAIESDDEDEYNPLSPSKPAAYQPPADVDVKFIGQFPSGRPLIFVSGDAGLVWGRGAALGMQQGGIYVNNKQVGVLFLPSWTRAAIIASETFTRLPLSIMNTYTTAIIERTEPTSVSLLDTYSVQGYIAPKMIPWEDAPVRYLSIGSIAISDPDLELFEPPNLLQSATASLLAGIFLRSLEVKRKEEIAAFFLLPSPKLPPPPPTTIPPSCFPSPEDVHWDQQTMKKVHRWLFEIVGESGNIEPWVERNDKSTGLPAATVRRAPTEIGEGGMYI
ncbi:hypothetical protein ID866_7867 [Astraeus odoratus]|nr:hypothetical protein ID866_7867 [Astraeus odoratus]